MSYNKKRNLLPFVLASSAIFLAIINCTFEASPEGGGFRFDASAPQPPNFIPPDQNDGEINMDGNNSLDSANFADQDNDVNNPDNFTWTSLYNSYFANAAPASCSKTVGACHGDPSASGALASDYVCSDQETCFSTMTEASGLVDSADINNPSGALIFTIIRQPGGIGSMPRNSTFTFQAADIARIKGWISNGALNN